MDASKKSTIEIGRMMALTKIFAKSENPSKTKFVNTSIFILYSLLNQIFVYVERKLCK